MATRLSESALWDDQRRWYSDRATAAWTDGLVPSGVLTGARTARQYAELVRSYVEDLIDEGGIDEAQPLYVLDLGAGSGRLGWHLQRELYDVLCEVPGAPEPVVVLTDFAAAMLEDWRAHPQAGQLAHALLDADQPGPIVLSNGEVLRHLANPLIAVASYFFDSLGADVFEVHRGALRELHVQLSDGGVAWTESAVQPYDNEVLDDVLERAAGGLSGAFLFPASSVRVLERLRDVAPRGVMVIAADKAICHPVGYSREHVLGLSFDGALSLRVNVHALRCWAQLWGGTALCPAQHDPRLSVAVLLVPGPESVEPRRLTRAYFEGVQTFGPLAYRAVQSAMLDSDLELDAMVSLLRLSCWDPDVLLALEPGLLVRLDGGSSALRNVLREALPTIAERSFVLDQHADVYCSLARLAVCLGDLSRAVRFYQRSLAVMGDRADTWHNLSVLYTQAGRSEAAQEARRHALQLPR